jgi:hypothetical protein
MESCQQQVDAIETDLRSHGFTDEEILKLWLVNYGSLLTEVLDNLPCPTFFNLILNTEQSEVLNKQTTGDQQTYIKSIKQKLATIK